MPRAWCALMMLAFVLAPGVVCAQIEMLGDFGTEAEVAVWSGDTPGAHVEPVPGGTVGARSGAFVYPGADGARVRRSLR